MKHAEPDWVRGMRHYTPGGGVAVCFRCDHCEYWVSSIAENTMDTFQARVRCQTYLDWHAEHAHPDKPIETDCVSSAYV